MRRRVGSAVVALMALAACGGDAADADRIAGSGDIAFESRGIEPFTSIDLRGEGSVAFAAGVEGIIEIETDSNLHEYIEIEVDGSELLIGTRAGVDIDPSDGVVYRLGCPVLDRVTLSGAGEVATAMCASAEEVTISLRGAGSIVVDALDADRLSATIAGAGSIRVAGRVDVASISVPGAGDFDGRDLEIEMAEAIAGGAGSITLWVTGTLDAEVSGVGDIEYSGDPQVTATVTGVGSIRKMD